MKVYVGNLPTAVTDAQLNEMAAPYGELLSATVVTERQTGISRGFGFLEYGNAEQGRAAISGLEGRNIDGRTIKVNEAKPKTAPASRH